MQKCQRRYSSVMALVRSAEFSLLSADFDDPFHKRYAIPLGAEAGAVPKLLRDPAARGSGAGTDSGRASNGTGTSDGNGAKDPSSSSEQVGEFLGQFLVIRFSHFSLAMKYPTLLKPIIPRRSICLFSMEGYRFEGFRFLSNT